jgi:hypothetical protein
MLPLRAFNGQATACVVHHASAPSNSPLAGALHGASCTRAWACHGVARYFPTAVAFVFRVAFLPCCLCCDPRKACLFGTLGLTEPAAPRASHGASCMRRAEIWAVQPCQNEALQVVLVAIVFVLCGCVLLQRRLRRILFTSSQRTLLLAVSTTDRLGVVYGHRVAVDRLGDITHTHCVRTLTCARKQARALQKARWCSSL